MFSRMMGHGSSRGVFSPQKAAGLNGLPRSEALQSGLEKIDRLIKACRLPFRTAAGNLLHWCDGRGRDRVLPASAFQTERFLLDHLRDGHRQKLISVARRRLISGELAPGRGSTQLEYEDSIRAPSFTSLFFALAQFAVRSRVETVVERNGNQLVLRFDRWRIEISDEYDWNPGTWVLMPGIGRVTFEELLALQMAGYGRRYRIRSDLATITDAEVTAPATLPAGKY